MLATRLKLLWNNFLYSPLEENRLKSLTYKFGILTGIGASETPRKVRFAGYQWEAYRFIYCVLNREIASRDRVVRHRCHNRLCVNPAHLEIGSQADNKRDDWEHWANGVDWDYL